MKPRQSHSYWMQYIWILTKRQINKHSLVTFFFLFWIKKQRLGIKIKKLNMKIKNKKFSVKEENYNLLTILCLIVGVSWALQSSFDDVVGSVLMVCLWPIFSSIFLNHQKTTLAILKF